MSLKRSNKFFPNRKKNSTYKSTHQKICEERENKVKRNDEIEMEMAKNNSYN